MTAATALSFALSLALSMVVLLVACGGTNANPDREVPPCTGAVAYHGKLPMHAPLLTSDWPADATDKPAWVDQAVPADLAQHLGTTLADLLQQTGAPGATVAIGGPGLGLWWQTRGLARTAPTRATDDQSVFMWDSVGKAYTAALVLNAVNKGQLQLGDSIDRWWPAFPEGACASGTLSSPAGSCRSRRRRPRSTG